MLAIPPAAVRTVHGVDYVSIAGGPGGPIDVAVILGEKFAGHDGDRVEILTGLKPGDRVIVP